MLATASEAQHFACSSAMFYSLVLLGSPSLTSVTAPLHVTHDRMSPFRRCLHRLQRPQPGIYQHNGIDYPECDRTLGLDRPLGRQIFSAAAGSHGIRVEALGTSLVIEINFLRASFLRYSKIEFHFKTLSCLFK